MKLSDLHNGQRAIIDGVEGQGAFRKRIMEMGFVKGREVVVVKSAPLKDPVYYRIMGYNVSLRRADAKLVSVHLVAEDNSRETATSEQPFAFESFFLKKNDLTNTEGSLATSRSRNLRIALIGNPNCGKTSLFNLASGAHERVGNYSGVTVEAKEAHMKVGDRRLDIIDLPGSYSLSPYSPEELYIRQYLTDPQTRPDVVIDVIDSCNLERNLYLLIQVKELGIPVVVALNMFDEFEKRKDKLNIPLLSQLLDVPMVPTVCRRERGIKELFEAVLALADKPQSEQRLLQVNYGTVLEPLIEDLSQKIATHTSLPQHFSARYLAVKLMEGDREVERQIKTFSTKSDFIFSARDYALKMAETRLRTSDIEALITDQRYGFIAGALRETYRPEKRIYQTLTDKIDRWLIHDVWGYPIFLAVLLLMFQCTFILGAYPMDWIDRGVGWLSDWVASFLIDGPLKELIISGIFSGVGGVIVFLPNILILYFFISVMEDTGYMSRAIFLMDKLMHKMGLHGKSFIPLIMGFGCNVPAVMGTRTIESRQSRLITTLITPFMSCSARLPVYLLLSLTFFPYHAGWVLSGLYLFGIVVAIVLALLFRKVLFKKEDTPFVMELPPYRMPTSRAVLIHMWEKVKEYLHKMGTIILLASIIVWFFGYYPRADVERQTTRKLEALEQLRPLMSEQDYSLERKKVELEGDVQQQEQSYLGRVGKAIQPFLAPLGFDWKMSIALVTGLPAKEVIVSSLSVIYTGEDVLDTNETLDKLVDRLRFDKDSEGNLSFTPLKALSFMFFVLLYFPCIATIVAISRETHSARWGVFVMVYTCVIAWVVSWVVFNVGSWLIS